MCLHVLYTEGHMHKHLLCDAVHIYTLTVVVVAVVAAHVVILSQRKQNRPRFTRL